MANPVISFLASLPARLEAAAEAAIDCLDELITCLPSKLVTALLVGSILLIAFLLSLAF